MGAKNQLDAEGSTAQRAGKGYMLTAGRRGVTCVEGGFRAVYGCDFARAS